MAVFNNFHNEQILKLDVKQQQPNKIPRFVQYDSALLKIELYDNGKLYDVSRAENFVISAKRPDGSTISGLADFDGEFINYKLSKQDLEILGETSARLQIYEGRHRLSSLSFRYDVYEDYETVGDPDDVTLLSALLSQVRDALLEAQRQGGYAENRGDFANAAGDYANSAGDSQKMRWLKWVKTVADRNRQYPNPRNGDTVYVVNVSDKNGGAVYRYNGVNRPFKWEEIAGWDTSIIQDIYNLIATKEDKTKVADLVEELQKDLEDTIFGGRNIVPQTDTSIEEYDKMYRPVVASSEVQMINTGDVAGRVVQARLAGDSPQSYFGATVGNSSRDRFSVKEGEELVLSFKGITSLTATDFTYVYLMRPSGEGNNRKMDLQFVRDVDHTGYDKYEFTVKSPWTSDNAYLLIGSQKRSEYVDAGHPFWIRFKDVQLERGNRATDWKPAIEDIITNFQNKISELEKENDDTFRQYDSRIKFLENEIKLTVTETVYDKNMQAIEEWQSEYSQTARNIQTTLSKKVGNDEIISRINQTAEKITIDANKIDLKGYVTFSNLANSGQTVIDGGNISTSNLSAISSNLGTVRTGRLLSKSNSTEWNLNTGALHMDNADISLDSGAHVHFLDSGNRMFYRRYDPVERRNHSAGVGFGTNINDRFPFSYLGATSRDTPHAMDAHDFRGFITNTATREEVDGIGQSVVGKVFQIRNASVNFNRGWTFDLRDSNNPAIRPMNTGSADYNIGASGYRFNRIYLKNSPNVSSDERLKTAIKPIDKASEIIKGLEPIQYRFKNSDNDLKKKQEGKMERGVKGQEYGFSAQRTMKLFEELGVTNQNIVEKGEDNYYGMRYEAFIPVLTAHAQDQSKVIDEQNTKIERLESMVEELMSKIK